MRKAAVVRFFASDFDLSTEQGRLEYVTGLFNACDFIKTIPVDRFLLNGFDNYRLTQAIEVFEKMAFQERKRLFQP